MNLHAIDEAGWIPVVAVLAGTLAATVTDLRSFRIPNRLTGILAAGGVMFHSATGGLSGLGFSMTGVLCGFSILICFYALGGLGAGDVKLMAAAGAWLGGPAIMVLFFASGLAAGGCALVMAVALRRPTFSGGRVARTVKAAVKDPGRRQRLVPFGAMMCLGLVAVLLCR